MSDSLAFNAFLKVKFLTMPKKGSPPSWHGPRQAECEDPARS